MDPQNPQIGPMMQQASTSPGPPPTASPDPVHGHKKHLLHNLMQKILGNSQGKSIQETISGIKDALGAYKNYAKEWDNLHQLPSAGKSNMPPGNMPHRDMRMMPYGQTQEGGMQPIPMPMMKGAPSTPYMPSLAPWDPNNRTPNLV